MKTYQKDILPHQEFYIVRFTKCSSLPYSLFIHGGPGPNCGVIEYLIEHHNFFSSLDSTSSFMIKEIVVDLIRLNSK